MKNSKSLAVLGRWVSAAALSMLVLTGCGGSDSPAPTPTPVPVNTAPMITVMLSGDVTPGVGGADVSAGAGGTLTLSGAGSSDAEGDALAYKWTIVSKPATSNLAFTTDTAVQQSFAPDVSGTYVFLLRITDTKGAYSEKKATILIRDNAAPVGNLAVTVGYSGQSTLKPTQGINIGSSVVLDASKSTDADGDAVTTTWSMLERPAASTSVLTSEGTTTRFVADVAGLYKVRARGTDPLGAYSDTVYVFDAANSAPRTLVLTTVLAAPGTSGENIIDAPAGYTVSLNGANSTDPSGTWLTYQWTLTKPAASQAQLSGTGDQTTLITPDVLGDYVVKLTATNAYGVASTYATTIRVTNRSPVAAIGTNVTPTALPSGPSIRLPVNSVVTLRGTGSVDADGDALTYAWSVAATPTGSAAVVSSASGSSVTLTVDLAGTYRVLLRVTDSTGAFSEQTLTIQAGNYAPVAVIDRSRITVLVGATATASAALSFDEERDPLTYAWAIDAHPASSSATIAAPSAATLSFTPDVAGVYVASLTVSDGVSSNVSYVTINALTSLAATVSLPFAPLESRYSRGLDKMVILTTNPNTLKIVDPFTGLIKSVVLPAGAIAMNLSPNGKLAGVLHSGFASLVDLDAATLLRSSALAVVPTEVVVNDSGMLYLYGSSNYNYSGVTVVNGRTGEDLSSTLGSSSYSIYGNYRGVFAGTKGRVLSVEGQSSYSIRAFDIDATTGKVSGTSTASMSNVISNQLFLAESEDLVFSSNGNYFRTDTLAYAGKLSYTGTMHSLSNSSPTEETLVMTTAQGVWPDYTPSYPSVYKRFAGALFLPDTDLALPTIGGAQSYGVNIFHSANGKHVALVQTGSNIKFGPGVSYYVLTR